MGFIDIQFTHTLFPLPNLLSWFIEDDQQAGTFLCIYIYKVLYMDHLCLVAGVLKVGYEMDQYVYIS